MIPFHGGNTGSNCRGCQHLTGIEVSVVQRMSNKRCWAVLRDAGLRSVIDRGSSSPQRKAPRLRAFVGPLGDEVSAVNSTSGWPTFGPMTLGQPNSFENGSSGE